MDTTTFTMNLRDLDTGFLRDLQTQNPRASVEIRLRPAAEKPALSEAQFWNIISKLDWAKTRNEDILAPAVSALSAMPISAIYLFQNILAEKLFQLDSKAFAREIGKNGWSPGKFFSVDNFLYARCCVVANGQETFSKVAQNPDLMPKDLTFEPLLRLAAEAYEQKTGQRMQYVPAYPIETFSNQKGWN